LDAFDMALEINPAHARALYEKGYVLDERGWYAEAREAFRKAVEMAPDYNDAWLSSPFVNKSMSAHVLYGYIGKLELQGQPEPETADLLSRAGRRTFEEAMGLLSEVEKAALPASRGAGAWQEGSLVHLPEEGEAIVIGDLHGRPALLAKLLDKTRAIERLEKGEALCLVFLGDYTDRADPKHFGDAALVEMVLELKQRFPGKVILLKGDHETGACDPHDFYFSMRQHFEKDGKEAYRRYMDFFRSLPIAAVSKKALFVHGGIPKGANSLGDLAHPTPEIEWQILWNDPWDRTYPMEGAEEFTSSHRGEGIYFFSGKAVDGFFKSIREADGAELCVLVRGHEHENEVGGGGRWVTVDSRDKEHTGYVVLDLAAEIRGAGNLGLKEA